jgi:hypothetical protein
MGGTWKSNSASKKPHQMVQVSVIMLMGIISMINLKLVGVAMDVNDLLHEAMMEMAQNDTHLLQAT